MTDTNQRTGGRVLVDAMLAHGVDTVFCVPGESYLAALDALYDSRDRIRVITCRHEGGAANMAEAYGKLTGNPGVVMVTRGPGACHGSIGLHTAHQDSTPMIMLIGQIDRGHAEREAFQEIDYRRFFGPICKWAAQIETADRVPEMLSQAFHRATSGRPGPVALALPEDMLTDLTDVADAGHFVRVEPGVPGGAIARLREHLQAARRPVVIAGGGGWTQTAVDALSTFVGANWLTTAASFRCQDRIDNLHPCYAGDLGLGIDPKLAERISGADLLVVVGARLGEMTTRGYTLAVPPCPPQKIVHVYPDPDEIGRVYQPALAICASVGEFLREAAAMAPVESPPWREATTSAHHDYLASLDPSEGLPGPVEMGKVMATLRERLPENAILTTDAGNFSAWMHRHYAYRKFPTQIGPTSGAMGYGIPAAIAARLVHPDRPVVAFCGDGGALMTGQELATAVHHGIDPVVLLVNNGMYGTIRMHQERDYPDRVIGTELTNPDFVDWARSFGAHAERVERTEQFAPALDRALAAGRIALIELRIAPELITTRATLSQIRGSGKR